MTEPFLAPTTPEKIGLRVEDFMLLADNGAFDHYGKTELIDGDIYVMNAQYNWHARTKSRLLVLLTMQLREIGSALEAVSEVAVRVTDDSMPEPDVVLTRWQGKGPVPVETVALIVEVADTTLDIDLGRKAVLYAAAGVPEYWVVDLNGGRLLIHRRPEADGYRGRSEVRLGDVLTAVTIDGLEIGSAGLVD